MKVLISIALFGLTLSELCIAQTSTSACTPEKIESETQTYNMCNAACVANVCDCCTQALNAGSSDTNYVCCSAYSELLQCASVHGESGGGSGATTATAVSDGDSGASTAIAVSVISGMMILVSFVVNQLIL